MRDDIVTRPRDPAFVRSAGDIAAPDIESAVLACIRPTRMVGADRGDLERAHDQSVAPAAPANEVR